MAETDTENKNRQGGSPPIVIDAGRTRSRNIRRLKQGGGKLMADVQQAVAEVRASLGAEAAGKELVPVVVVYRRKRRRRGGLLPFLAM